MKHLIKYFLSFLLCVTLSVLFIPNNTVKAAETLDSIENNSIKLLAYEYPFNIKEQWLEFRFVDQGNNTAKLKYYSNGEILSVNDIQPNLALYEDLYFGLTNIYGFSGVMEMRRGRSMRDVAAYLESLTFTYNVDTIQIARMPNIDWHHGTEGSPVFTYEGKIQSNLIQLDFNPLFWFHNHTQLWRFRVRKDGLHAEYIKQVKVPDGEYIIETVENPNRVLDVLSGDNVGTSDYIPGAKSQIFTLEYDDGKKAYKIKLNGGSKVLNWDKSNGKNVIASENKYPGEFYGEQYWYLQDAGNGAYKIVSARKTSEFLNLDANNTNISVAENRNNLNQQFKLVKVEEKESILDGQWKIVSKLNNNKVLNVHIGGLDPKNVTIWDDANVSQQKWDFEYDYNKKAYLIKDCYSNSYLSWDPSSGTTNVRSVNGHYFNGAYWVLEYVGNGYYVFKNYHNQNMVLDLTGSNVTNGSNIIVHKRHNSDNQQFKITR